MTINWAKHSDFEYSIYVPDTAAKNFNLHKFSTELKKMQGCGLIIINSIFDSTSLRKPQTVIRLTLSNHIPIQDFIPTIQEVVNRHLGSFVAPTPVAPRPPASKKRTFTEVDAPVVAPVATQSHYPEPCLLRPFDGAQPNFIVEFGGSIPTIENARTFTIQQSTGTIPAFFTRTLTFEKAQAIFRNPIILSDAAIQKSDS